MKVRNTFVSNSSSASYILHIPTEFDTLLHILDDDEIGYDVHSMKIWLEDQIRLYNEFIEQYSDNSILPWTSDHYIERKDELEKVLLSLDDMSEEDRFRTFCLLQNVVIDESVSNRTTFIANTSMHNYYKEDLNHILRNLVLFLTFEKQYPLTGICEHHD